METILSLRCVAKMSYSWGIIIYLFIMALANPRHCSRNVSNIKHRVLISKICENNRGELCIIRFRSSGLGESMFFHILARGGEWGDDKWPCEWLTGNSWSSVTMATSLKSVQVADESPSSTYMCFSNRRINISMTVSNVEYQTASQRSILPDDN